MDQRLLSIHLQTG